MHGVNLKFGIEKEFSLISFQEGKVFYNLDSEKTCEKIIKIGEDFLKNGWNVKQEYTYSIIEFVSPVYSIDDLDEMLKDLISLNEAVNQFNKNGNCLLSDKYSNVTPFFRKDDIVTDNKSDIYIDDQFLLSGEIKSLPIAYEKVDPHLISRIYDGLISTDINVSFGRILTKNVAEMVAEKMLEVSMKYEANKRCYDDFFFDGEKSIGLNLSARDYFLNWVNPKRLNGIKGLCFSDPYTCRIKETSKETIIECKNLHPSYTPETVKQIMKSIAKNMTLLGLNW